MQVSKNLFVLLLNRKLAGNVTLGSDKRLIALRDKNSNCISDTRWLYLKGGLIQYVSGLANDITYRLKSSHYIGNRVLQNDANN